MAARQHLVSSSSVMMSGIQDEGLSYSVSEIRPVKSQIRPGPSSQIWVEIICGGSMTDSQAPASMVLIKLC